MSNIVIYRARVVRTMNPAKPTGDAIAVRDGKILGVGTVEELAAWGDHTVDDSFADKVLMPGFVESHCHAMSGGMWLHPYVGFFDRRSPDGRLWRGCGKIDEVVDRVSEINAQMAADGIPEDQPLIAWGVDPLYFDGERMYREHLDRASETRPIFLHHASGHLATVNTAMLDASGITAETPTPGIPLGADGVPNGELQEPAAMRLAGSAFDGLMAGMGSPDSLWRYAFEARNCGVTTVTDLGGMALTEQRLSGWEEVTADPDFPMRAMLAVSPEFTGATDHGDLADQVADKVADSADKLHFGIIKLVLDGSIQGFTARLNWPYYINPPEGAAENGIWLMPPDQMAEIVTEYHRRGLTVHCHCNGDQATEVFVDAVEAALENHPRFDTRHTVQHCQLTTKAQYRKMAALGMCANIFSNHIWYWGDQHRDFTVGHERARGMDACATALREGVSFSIHSDSPVTPMGHLHTAWCAVNRITPDGDVLGEDEQISVHDAMYACTIGGAHQIKMDHLIGSLEAGKLADFAVLEDDPYEVDPVELKNIEVWGTVVGGVSYRSTAD